MPITKVPLVHKFGIISLSEAERIIRQQRFEKHKARRKSFINKSTSCPVITADFITKYNSCFEGERTKFNSVLKRVLEHAKYKSCSSDKVDSNTGNHEVDQSEGWLELIMICQCCGPLQEESLVSLYDSLSSCTVSPSHIPALFYISGLCYYWLKTETTPSILRSGELLLLKVLHRVCWRLYLHHLASNLQELCSYTDVQQLKFDMEGFEKCEPTYHNFPEALLHWRIAMEVGSLICERYTTQLSSASILSVVSEEEDGELTPTTPATDDITKSSSVTSSAGSGGCGHSLAPVLWHALDIWQCNHQELSALPDAMQDFLSCSTNFKTQHWLEGLLAMEILSEAARLNEVILYLMQSLAAGNSNIHSTPRQSSGSDSNYDSTVKAVSLSQYKSTSTTPDSINGGSVTVMESSDDADSKPLLLEAGGKQRVTTLNVLGMQPTFTVDTDIGSEYTSYTAIEEMEEEDDDDDDDDEYTCVGDSNGLQQHTYSEASVDTQALIDTESIPDTPLTTHSDDSSVPNLSAIDSSDLSELKGYSTIVSLAAKDSSGGLVDVTLEENENGGDEGGSDGMNEQPQQKKGKKVTLVSLPHTPVSSPPVSDCSIVSDGHHEDESILHRIRLLDDRFEVVGVLKNHQSVGGGGPKSVTLNIMASSPRADSRCTHYTHSTAPFSWVGDGVLGSHVPPSTVYQQSILSSLSQSIGSDTNSIISKKIGLHSFKTWPMEIQLTYTLNMGNLVVNGANSNIQRMALLGPTEESTNSQYSLNCLKDYENTTADSKKSQGGESWYIRHCVILALCRICQLCKDHPTQDGMSEIAWNIIQQRTTAETEPKVLEAQKLHQSCCVSVHPLTSTRTPSPRPSSSGPVNVLPSVFGYMAGKLANLYLPPDVNTSLLTNAMNKPSKNKSSKEVTKKKQSYKIKQAKVKAKVETVRKPELSQYKPPQSMYMKKTSDALNDIMKKHWELQMKLEEEEEEARLEHSEK